MLGLINQHMDHMPQISKPMWVAKSGRKCASLDGVNDYINCGDFSGDLDGQDGFTLAFWIKNNDPDGIGNSYLMHLGGDGSTNDMVFGIEGVVSGGAAGGTLRYTYADRPFAPTSNGSDTHKNNYRYKSTGGTDEWDYATRNLNRWVPIVLTWDKDTNSGSAAVKVGVGSLVSDSGAVTSSLPTMSGTTAVQSMYIGAYNSSLGPITYEEFKVAEVAIWRTRLAEADILLFQAGIDATDIPNPLSGLIHYWKFNNDVEDYGGAADSDATAVNGADTNAEVID